MILSAAQKALVFTILVWVTVFAVMKGKHFQAGYSASAANYTRDLKAQHDCIHDIDHRLSYPVDCVRLDSLTWFTAFFSGWDRVYENTYFCIGMKCEDALRIAEHSIQAVGATLAIAAVISALGGVFIYVILARSLQLAGNGHDKYALPNAQTAFGYVTELPDQAKRKFIHFIGADGTEKHKRLQWHEDLEIDH